MPVVRDAGRPITCRCRRSWFGGEYFSDQIHVDYQDTIGDMMLGGIGGAVAGALLALIDVRRVPAPLLPAPEAMLSGRRR